MAKLLVLSLTVLFCVVLGLVKGDSVEDAKEAISEVGTTKEGAKYCPAPLLGTRSVFVSNISLSPFMLLEKAD